MKPARVLFWIIAAIFCGTLYWQMVSDMLASENGKVVAFGVISLIGIAAGLVGYYDRIFKCK